MKQINDGGLIKYGLGFSKEIKEFGAENYGVWRKYGFAGGEKKTKKKTLPPHLVNHLRNSQKN